MSKIKLLKIGELEDGKPHYNEDIDLSYSAITELPEGLVVHGYLDLSHTNITELPDGLVVHGDIIR